MRRLRRFQNYTPWNEFDDMMAEIENRFLSALTSGSPRVYGMLPAIKGECTVDVRESETEIIVVADLPGVNKEDITLNLIDPRTLEISCERKTEVEEKEAGYYMRERAFGEMKRTVSLPGVVTEEGGNATFKNGVLEVHIKRAELKKVTPIAIE